jgi:hypothetical protein
MAERESPKGDIAGHAYLDLIRQQLDAEVHRKDSLEHRGLAILASSGTLVAVVLGLVTLALSVGGVALTDSLRLTLLATLGLFMLAAVFGILVSSLRAYDEVKVSELHRILSEDFWEGPVVVGTRRSGEVLVKILEAARKRNNTKAKLLTWSLWLEVGGTLTLTTGIALILLD